MKRLLLLLTILPAACSPPPEEASAPKSHTAVEPAPVPYSKLDWKEDVYYLDGKPFTGVTEQ